MNDWSLTNKFMKIIDLHSHWGTKIGYPLRSTEELELQKRTWNSLPKYESEEEMVGYFRARNVQVFLDLGFTKTMPVGQVQEFHDYVFEVQKNHGDVIIGNWLQIDPRTGKEGLREFERCLSNGGGVVGYAVSGSPLGLDACDPLFGPYYALCAEAGAPVLIMVGYTGLGAGHPGGKGIVLDLSHPRYVDRVAANYPELNIIAGRPAWPWQDEMIAVMLHKPNVWCELHGWSPKYLTDGLKYDISRRLRGRIMFGADYPLFRYERLVSDWQAQGFDEGVLERVFYKNAESFLDTLGG